MSAPKPIISFILPVLNEAEHIAIQLARLQDYRARGHEVVLVDGGSSDETLALVADLAKAIALGPSKSDKTNLVDVVEQTAPGRSLQMNRGAARASGELLLFLHVDTCLPERVDDLLAERVHSAARTAGAITDTGLQPETEHASPLDARAQPTWGWFDVSLSNPAWPYPLIARNMNRRARWTSVCTGDQAMFVNRQLFDSVDGFPDIALMEDIAISKLLRRRAVPLVIDQPAISSSRRWEVNGVLRTVLLMWWLRLQYFLGVSPSKLLKKYYPARVSKSQ